MRWGGDSLPHDSRSTDYGAMALTTARIRKDFFVESAVLIIAESLTRWVGTTAHWDPTRNCCSRVDLYRRRAWDNLAILAGCGLLLHWPKFRADLRQPAANAKGRNLFRQSFDVELNRETAKRRSPGCRLKTRGGQLGHEAVNRPLLLHADDGIIIPGHP